MEQAEEVLAGFWDLFNKRIFLDEIRMKDCLKGTTPSEVHAIEYIGEHADANVTKLADAFYMTRSGVSKLLKKLLKKGLAESYQKPDNKKEIYFSLTEQGLSVYQTHARLHQDSRERDEAVFAQVTAEQLETMRQFAELYNRHLDEEMKKVGADPHISTFDKF